MRVPLLALFAVFLVAAPLAAEAQAPAKVSRIGFLASGVAAGTAPRLEVFRQGLHDLGYVEGRNIVIEYRWAEGKVERLPALAVELVGLKVDVVVAVSTPDALAAKKATRTIPIVALLKEAVPKASPVAVLSNPANPYTALMVKETEAAARSLGVRVQLHGVRGADALDGAFSVVTKERPGALFVLFDPLLFVHRTRIAEFANKNRLPAIYPHREYAEVGGLMAYGADLRDNYRRAATYVDRILKGAKPADLPVEQPTKFELVINLKTAKALGLTIPPSLLQRADEVIQ